MTKPVTGLNTFQTQTGPIPLSQLDANFTALQNAANDVATYSNYLTDSSGAANQITVTTNASITFAYTAGIQIQVQLANTNTSGTVNINVNSLGNKLVKLADLTNPGIGQLKANAILALQYDGTQFQVLGGAVSGSTGLFADGTAGSPSISFASDQGMGFYKAGTDILGCATGGVQRLNLDASSQFTILSAGSFNPLSFLNSSATANNQRWGFRFGGTNDLSFGTIADAGGNTVDLAFDMRRSGTTVTEVDLGNITTFPPIKGGGPVAGAMVDMTPDTGTFTGSATGMTAAVNYSCTWSRIGKLVTLAISGASGTSNATSFTMTGLPAAIQPASVTPRIQLNPAVVFDNGSAIGTSSFAEVSIASGSGTLTFLKAGLSTGWTNAGTKGIASGATITFSYLLN